MRVRRSIVIGLGTATLLALCHQARAQTASPETAQRAAPAPPAPSGPAPLGVNGQLAPWFQLRGEFRVRIEGVNGGGFADNADNHDAYWMDRFRLNATIRPTKSIGFFVQAQDARAFDKTTGGRATPLRNTIDLRQAYGEFGTTTAVRVGRQELAFGEQRLIGHVSWLNNARTFDAARATIKRRGLQLDVFAASVVTIQPDAFDKSGSGNALYGVYGSVSALVPKQLVEPFFFWRQSRGVVAELGGTADIHQATTGFRMAGKLPSDIDYSGEMAIQTGSVGPDSVKAWAGHGLVGKTLGAAALRPRLFGEYNHASGDANRTDGTRGTFDQLYPTAHDKYGLADQVGWRNIKHARAGLEFKPFAKAQLTGVYHSWWLASPSDALYSATGAAVARSATGTAGRHVGQEIDAQVAYNYSPQLQIGGGYAYLFPGEFLKNTTPGHSYSYPYVMVTYVFLGDQPKRPAAGGSR